MVRFKICLILSVRGKDYIKLNDFSFKEKKKECSISVSTINI